MTIKMDMTKFNSLDVDAVGHVCFEPMVTEYQARMRQRNGQSPQEIRAEFYKSLTLGQRALFMFFTYYDHAIRSKDEFHSISSNYLSEQIFRAVIRGAEYFGDVDMPRLLSNIEQTIPSDKGSEVSVLYERFCDISPRTLAVIGACIKKSPSEYVCLE